MKITFLTDNFPPEVNAPATRTYEHCKEWAALGHDVTVITCAPNYPTGKTYDGYKNKLIQKSTSDGMLIIRVWTYMAPNSGFLLRVIDQLTFMFSATFFGIFTKKPDVYIGTSPQFFTMIATYILSKIKRKPYVFEVRDIWPASIKAVGLFGEGKIYRLLEKLELFLYNNASIVIVVTNAFKKNLSKRGIDVDKIHVVTNGVDGEKFRRVSPSSASALRQKLKLKKKFICGYIGTLGMAHHLETVLQVAELSKKNGLNHIHFLFVGTGANKKNLELLSRRKNLFNVTFVDLIPKDQIFVFWAILDLTIIHLRKTSEFTEVIPSKIFEAMAAGVPMVNGVQGETAAIIKNHNIGLNFEPENAHELLYSISQIESDKQLHSELSRNSKLSALRYSRQKLAKKMLKILQSIPNTEDK